MNAKAVVFISCRLLAIYLIVVHILIAVFQLIAGLLAQPEMMQDPSFFRAMGGVTFGIATYGLVALLLWVMAGWLSRLISAPFPDAFGEDIEFHRWQAVIVMALGGIALFRAAAFGAEILRASPELLGFVVRGTLGFAVLGIGLIVFSPQIVRGLNRARDWASKPFIKVEEEK